MKLRRRKINNFIQSNGIYLYEQYIRIKNVAAVIMCVGNVGEGIKFTINSESDVCSSSYRYIITANFKKVLCEQISINIFERSWHDYCIFEKNSSDIMNRKQLSKEYRLNIITRTHTTYNTALLHGLLQR